MEVRRDGDGYTVLAGGDALDERCRTCFLVESTEGRGVERASRTVRGLGHEEVPGPSDERRAGGRGCQLVEVNQADIFTPGTLCCTKNPPPDLPACTRTCPRIFTTRKLIIQ